MKIDPKKEQHAYVAYSEGTPVLRVKLGDTIIDKHLPCRAGVPIEGNTDRPVGYACVLSPDPDNLRYKFFALLAHKLADEIRVFNWTIEDINKAMGSDLKEITVAELSELLIDGPHGIQPKWKGGE